MSGDSSGNLSLLSGATTVVAVTSAGVAVTGTLSASGAISKTNTAATTSQAFGSTGSTTGATYGLMTNTSGSLAWGVEASSPATIVGGSTAYAGLIYTTTNTPLQLGSNNIIYATLSSTGLAVTGLVDISAATSGQIQFPATQNASANANTLDDYEEGTFTVTDQSGAGLTFSNNTGRYVKVGGLVYFAMDVIFPTTASVTNIALSLPFQSGTSCAFSAAVGYSNSGSIPSAYIGISQSRVSIYSTTGVAVTNVTFSGKELAISGCYPTT
jgi:hypothetical protein